MQAQLSSAGESNAPSRSELDNTRSAPLKKRRLVNGKEMVFRRPGEDGEGRADDASEEEPGPGPENTEALPNHGTVDTDVGPQQVREVSEPRIIIHEDD